MKSRKARMKIKREVHNEETLNLANIVAPDEYHRSTTRVYSTSQSDKY